MSEDNENDKITESEDLSETTTLDELEDHLRLLIDINQNLKQTIKYLGQLNTKLCLNIPNVMSLSSKVGNNIFYVNTGDVKEFKCEIYNRWGSVMSTLSGQKDGWDGRDKFGKIVDEGVYFYKLNITFNNGTSVSQDGNFLLMY